MILADKIIKLRKQFGWSQEELAEKMNVSRQSVSKWESTASIPDLNKIIKLADIFGVTTDYLVKDDMEEVATVSEDRELSAVQVTLEEARDYLEKKMAAAKTIAAGVLFCISSVIPLFFLLALAEGGVFGLGSRIATIIGLISLLAMIAVGVVFFIGSSQNINDFERFEQDEFELAYGVRSVFKEMSKEFRPIYTARISVGIVMYLFCPVPLITVSLLGVSGMVQLMMVVLLIVMVAFATCIIIPVSTEHNAYQLIIGEGVYAPRRKNENRRMEKLSAFYWPLVTAIYIGWSLWTMNWGITWIVWPVAGIAFAALLGLVSLFSANDE